MGLHAYKAKLAVLVRWSGNSSKHKGGQSAFETAWVNLRNNGTRIILTAVEPNFHGLADGMTIKGGAITARVIFFQQYR